VDKILLFIPAYNCEKQIPRVLQQLDSEVVKYITEVIVVNNRSTDKTESVVRKFAGSHPELNIHLLRNSENYNLGGSHKVAFKYAADNGFDYVIVLHGDDQGDIHDLLPLLRHGVYKKYDCCLGSRFMSDSKLGGYSKFRTIGNRVYNFIFSISTFSVVKDLGSGLNIYKVDILRDKFYEKFPDALMFNCLMLFANKVHGFTSLFFPISWREDDQISNVKLFSQAAKTLKIAIKFFFSNKHKYIQKEFRSKPITEYLADDVTEVSE
jgi:glycosyltransferase involved in cell wall biosynthesis